MKDGVKKILLWSFTPDDWQVCCKVLDDFFAGEAVEIEKMSFVTQTRANYDDIDLALVTASEWYHFVKQLVPEGVPVIWIKHTIDQENFDKLSAAAQTQKISVVADTPFYAEQRLRMLVGLGLRENALEIWYPGLPEDKLGPIVLIFEEAGLTWEPDREYIHFYGRGMISTETLIQMAAALNMLHLLETDFYRKYNRSVKYASRQISDLIDIGDYYAAAQKKVVNGLLYFVPDGLISHCNFNAAVLLGISSSQIIGKTLPEVFPFLGEWMDRLEEFGERVVKFGGRELVFDLWTTSTHGIYAGYILISDYKAEKEKELRLRTQMLKKRQHAKYTVYNIKGESEAIERCRKTAMKFARSRASVLITGASGTGKELFASAIHNASARRDGPFVPINCGALVESLLESELFGYESGAFTGAKKEGKQGLFEVAHGGTLFLDEIGEMPLGLQVKLLRALQEREVVRVGGHNVIPVDVRIIAATNRDLRTLVEEGKFRTDLYYRLNVLPLELPGLDERREDILPLFYDIRNDEGYSFELDREARACIMSHNYEGNVRELHNCVEYLGSLEQDLVRYEDLPSYMKEGTHSCTRGREPALGTEGLSREADLVLGAVRALKEQGKAAGRRSICLYLRDRGENLSEMRIRTILEELSGSGEIGVGKGRMGVWINPNRRNDPINPK